VVDPLQPEEIDEPFGGTGRGHWWTLSVSGPGWGFAVVRSRSCTAPVVGMLGAVAPRAPAVGVRQVLTAGRLR
jgi:hypothetical protein